MIGAIFRKYLGSVLSQGERLALSSCRTINLSAYELVQFVEFTFRSTLWPRGNSFTVLPGDSSTWRSTFALIRRLMGAGSRPSFRRRDVINCGYQSALATASVRWSRIRSSLIA